MDDGDALLDELAATTTPPPRLAAAERVPGKLLGTGALGTGARKRPQPQRESDKDEKKQRVQPDEKQYETYASGIVERRKKGDLEGGEPEGGWQALQRALVVLQRDIGIKSRVLQVSRNNAQVKEALAQFRRQLELGLTSSEFQTLLSQEQSQEKQGCSCSLCQKLTDGPEAGEDSGGDEDDVSQEAHAAGVALDQAPLVLTGTCHNRRHCVTTLKSLAEEMQGEVAQGGALPLCCQPAVLTHRRLRAIVDIVGNHSADAHDDLWHAAFGLLRGLLTCRTAELIMGYTSLHMGCGGALGEVLAALKAGSLEYPDAVGDAFDHLAGAGEPMLATVAGDEGMLREIQRTLDSQAGKSAQCSAYKLLATMCKCPRAVKVMKDSETVPVVARTLAAVLRRFVHEEVPLSVHAPSDLLRNLLQNLAPADSKACIAESVVPAVTGVLPTLLFTPGPDASGLSPHLFTSAGPTNDFQLVMRTTKRLFCEVLVPALQWEFFDTALGSDVRRFVTQQLDTRVGISQLRSLVQELGPRLAEQLVTMGIVDIVLAKVSSEHTSTELAADFFSSGLVELLLTNLDPACKQRATIDEGCANALDALLEARVGADGIEGVLERLCSQDQAESKEGGDLLRAVLSASCSAAWKQRVKERYSEPTRRKKLVETLCLAVQSSTNEGAKADARDGCRELVCVLGSPFASALLTDGRLGGGCLHKLMHDVQRNVLRVDVLRESTYLVEQLGAFSLLEVQERYAPLATDTLPTLECRLLNCVYAKRPRGDPDENPVGPELKAAMGLACALRSASEPSERLIVQAANMGNSGNSDAPNAHKLLEALTAHGVDVPARLLSDGASDLTDCATRLLDLLSVVASGMEQRVHRVNTCGDDRSSVAILLDVTYRNLLRKAPYTDQHTNQYVVPPKRVVLKPGTVRALKSPKRILLNRFKDELKKMLIRPTPALPAPPSALAAPSGALSALPAPAAPAAAAASPGALLALPAPGEHPVAAVVPNAPPQLAANALPFATVVSSALDAHLRPVGDCAKCAAGLADQTLLKTYNTAVKMSKAVDASAKPACALWSHAISEERLVGLVMNLNGGFSALQISQAQLAATLKVEVRNYMATKYNTCLLGNPTKYGSKGATRNPVQLYMPIEQTGRYVPVDKGGVLAKDFKHYDVYMGFQLIVPGAEAAVPALAGGGLTEDDADEIAPGAQHGQVEAAAVPSGLTEDGMEE